MAFTYILKCADGSYYTGVTNDIQRRPVELAWCSDDVDIASAICTEKQIKGWRRAKKEALISGSVDALPVLSVAYVHKSHPSTILRPSSGQGSGRQGF